LSGLAFFEKTENLIFEFMILRIFTFIFAALGATSLTLKADTNSYLPAPYQAYQVDTSSLAPDGHLAVIVPKELLALPDTPLNFLVALDPFRVLCQLPTDANFSDSDRRGGLVVNWAKNNSAAVMFVAAKWGPGKVYVVSLPKERPPEITDLDAEIRKLLQPSYVRAQVAPFNDSFDYIFDSELGGGFSCSINEENQVVIDGVATTDPKNVPRSLHWTAHFNGLWDIAGHKFVSQQIQAKVSEDNE
jgi:hypothetical protein